MGAEIFNYLKKQQELMRSVQPLGVDNPLQSTLDAIDGQFKQIREIEKSFEAANAFGREQARLSKAASETAQLGERFMTMQRAAERLLKEAGCAMPSRQLAELALARGFVSSTAKDPVHSLAQTLEKNIRDQLYNDPPLRFVQTDKGRMLGLVEWPDPVSPSGATQETTVSINLPQPLMDALGLAVQAKLASTHSEALVLFAQEGIAHYAPAIRSAIEAQLKQISPDSATDDPLV
jgi:hypothetical protein